MTLPVLTELYNFKSNEAKLAHSNYLACPIGPDKGSLFSQKVLIVFIPLPFEEWWKGHIVLPLSVCQSPSASDISNLHLRFSGEGIHVLGHISSCTLHGNMCLTEVLLISNNNIIYSRTSLSRTRLFRITAYLEVKIWSLF